MSAVEYSLIFLSIVIGYVVTVSMVSWGKLIKYYDYQKFSILYLLWSIVLFLYLLFVWFWTFSYNLGLLESYFWSLLLLVRPLMIYFCLEVLIPDNLETVNYWESFLKTKNKFFILLTILWVYEIGLMILKWDHELLGPWSVHVLFNFCLSISLVFIKSLRYLRVATFAAFIFTVLSLASHLLLQYLE